MQMQAALLTESNTPFRIETVELDPPKAGEVLVKVAAAGVCHSDWHVVEGKSYFPFPIITGHEGAGVVEAVGEGVTRMQPGDHVTLSFRADCGDCFYCQNDKSVLCETFADALRSGLQLDGTSRIRWRGEPVYIMTGLGCFAEYVVIPHQACVPIRATFRWRWRRWWAARYRPALAQPFTPPRSGPGRALPCMARAASA